MPVKTQQIKAGFWAIDLALTAVAVFFLVKAVQSLFMSPALAPEPLIDSSRPGGVGIHEKIGPREKYALLESSDLFGALSSSSVAAKKPKEEDLPETTLELELLGCVVAGVPELSIAIIREKKKRTADTYRVGDIIVEDAEVEEIRESEVVIFRAGKRETLSMAFGDKAPSTGLPGRLARVRRSRSRPLTHSSKAPDRAIRVVNDKLRIVNREKLSEDVSQNLGSFLSSFRTSPNTDGDKPAGVNVDAIGSDPVSSQIGIQPGDTVKSVNGIRVNSLEDILGLNERLQNAPEIRVVVERQGRHTTLVYKIR